jgi:hypothetical protein
VLLTAAATPPTSLAAAIAGAAGLALGRASVRNGMHRAAVTALAVAAVPLANLVLSRLLGPAAGGGASGPPPRSSGGREQRRRQLLRAAQAAADEAAAAGSISPEEQALLALVMQPAQSRPERVRTIARVLEWLQAIEADPSPRSERLVPAGSASRSSCGPVQCCARFLPARAGLPAQQT